MTQQWWTPVEAAALVGLSDRRMRDKLESWALRDDQKRKRAGKGGGWEYHVSCFPQEIKDQLLDASIPAHPAPATLLPVPAAPRALVLVVAPAELPPPATLKGWQRRAMDARAALLQLLEQLISAGGVEKAIKAVVKRAAEGTLPAHLQELVPSANARGGKNGGRTLSSRTLARWRAALAAANGNVVALAPLDCREDPRLPAERRKSAPAWAPLLLKCWRKPMQPFLTDVLEELRTLLPPGGSGPSYDQARGFLQKLGELERQKGRLTGAALDALKPHRRRDTSHMLPGDAYTADGHCFDAEVAHPFHGRPFRPEITPVLDIATRKCVGWSCDLAENGLAVVDALRAACEQFGPPAIFYTDNGPGFKNQMLTAPGLGILNRLGIHPEYSRPRNAKAHGISERGHRTILVKAAKELCTYIGASMDGDTKQLVFKATRKAIKNPGLPTPLIEWDDFLTHVNAAITAYNTRSHRGLPALRDPATRKRTHLSPDQAWQLGMQRMIREVPVDQHLVPANELADLYHPMVERTVLKGEVQIGSKSNGLAKRYYSAALKEHHGERVHVALSPSDPSKVWVRSIGDQRLLAVAKLEGNASPYFALSLIEEKRAQRGKARHGRLLRQAEEIELEMRGPAAVLVPPTPAASAAQQRLELAMAQDEAEIVTPAPRPLKGNYARWKALEEKSATVALDEEEQLFFTGFATSAEWRAMRSMEEDFGDFYALAK